MSVISCIGIKIINRISYKNKVKQEIIIKLTEEELRNVNIKELVEDITSGIKYAKHKEVNGNSITERLLNFQIYEGDGYTIENNGGGDCISYSYYCGDKKVYSTMKIYPLEIPKKSLKRIVEENKEKIVVGMIIIVLAIMDFIFFIKYRRSKRV